MSDKMKLIMETWRKLKEQSYTANLDDPTDRLQSRGQSTRKIHPGGSDPEGRIDTSMSMADSDPLNDPQGPPLPLRNAIRLEVRKLHEIVKRLRSDVIGPKLAKELSNKLEAIAERIHTASDQTPPEL